MNLLLELSFVRETRFSHALAHGNMFCFSEPSSKQQKMLAIHTPEGTKLEPARANSQKLGERRSSETGMPPLGREGLGGSNADDAGDAGMLTLHHQHHPH